MCGRYFDCVPCSPVGLPETGRLSHSLALCFSPHFFPLLPLESLAPAMHLFKRSKSIVAKNVGRQQDSSSSPSSSSSSRQPLVPQTNIDHRTPKSPLSSIDDHSSSSNFSSSDSSQSKRLLGRKISHLDAEGPTGLKTSQYVFLLFWPCKHPC